MTEERLDIPETRGPGEAAGVVLAILGAVESLLGVLFGVYAWLYRDPASLPDWVDTGSVPGNASVQLFLLGGAVLLFAGAQVASGLVVHRSGESWARWMGIILSTAGMGIGLAAILPPANSTAYNLVFLPVVAAYGYVAVALALGRRG